MFGILGSILSARTQAQNAKLMERQYMSLLEHDRYIRGEPIMTPAEIVKALTAPPVRERIVERDTGIGVGTVVAAFVLGGMLS